MVRFLTSTPRRAWPLAVAGVLLYASAPLFAIAYYGEMLRKDAYPPDADSIAIPISEDIRAAFLFAPIFVGLLVLSLRNYPGSVSLRAWNRARPLWSWICTVVFAVLIAATATALIDAWRWRLPLEVLNVALWVWLLLALRAVMVARPVQIRPAA